MNSGFRVIDSELHLMEPYQIWEERLPEPYRSLTHVVPPAGLSERLRIEYGANHVHDGATSEIRGLVRRLSEHRMAADPRLAYAARNCRPDIWLEDMDVEGIDVAVVLPTSTMSVALVDGLDPKHAMAMSRVYNDWAAEFCAANPERLKFWAWLPRHDAHLAAEESRRCMEELGAVGVAFSTHTVDDHLLSDTFYDPLWAELNRLRAPIGMHVTGSAQRDNIRTRYQGHARTEVLMRAIAGVYYSMSSVGELILAGVLDRYPLIKPVVMETSAGWVPWLLWRMDDMWELFGPHAGYALGLKPSEYFRRQCYVVADSDDGLVRHAIDSGLGDCILFSGDYPHPDSPYPHAVSNFLNIEGLTEAERRKILWDNGARLFGIGVAEAEAALTS
jgi:predicted TIM-barrel fold metal-dependent hydrolase